MHLALVALEVCHGVEQFVTVVYLTDYALTFVVEFLVFGERLGTFVVLVTQLTLKLLCVALNVIFKVISENN